MKLIYGIHDKPKFGQVILFAIQQLLAIMAATLVVPIITNNNADVIAAHGGAVAMSPAAALLGAGVGTLVYLCFTKFKSPVFLGSSFAFLGSLAAAFAGAASVAIGYVGIIIGAVLAGLVYVIIALLVKLAGVNWLNKLMPPVVIGPTVAIIGLSLAGNAVGDLQKGDTETGSVYVALICGLIALIVTVLCSTYGKKMMKFIPFIIGILAGTAAATIFTIIGDACGIESFKLVDFSNFTALWAEGVNLETFVTLPNFTFVEAFDGIKGITLDYILTVAVAYVPVAFVVFAEHVADHKNISSIIETDLLEEPGLHRTLLGDGVGSMAGAFFGGCPAGFCADRAPPEGRSR